MDIQEMMHRLLATINADREERKADRKTDQEQMNANTKTILAKMEADRKTDQVEMNANNKTMLAEM
jgi:hypothetical protein